MTPVQVFGILIGFTPAGNDGDGVVAGSRFRIESGVSDR